MKILDIENRKDMHTALTRVTCRVVQHPWITGAAAGGRFLTGSRVAAAAPPPPSPSDGDGGGAAAPSGYTSIGSFHSDDIEVLQRLPAAEYAAPTVPFSTETVDASFAKLPAAAAAASPPSSAPPLSFGRELKEEFFMLDKDWTFVRKRVVIARKPRARQCWTEHPISVSSPRGRALRFSLC